MSLPATPHDALFRALVSNPQRAAALLRDHLPNEVAALLDPDIPPEPVEGSFVDGEGAKTQCDALFRVQLRTGQPARIYVLLEHKSRVDGATPLQLARYMLNIWTRSLEENGASRSGRLPTIIPIVFYHGRGDWTAPLSLAEMIDAPEGVEDPLRGFAYTLRDLGQIEPLDLSRAPDVRAGLLALRLVYADTVPSELLDLMTGGPVDGSACREHFDLSGLCTMAIVRFCLPYSVAVRAEGERCHRVRLGWSKRFTQPVFLLN